MICRNVFHKFNYTCSRLLEYRDSLDSKCSAIQNYQFWLEQRVGILTHTEHVLVSLFDRVFNAGSCTAAIVAYDGRNRTASKRPIETDFQEPRFQ